jgi:hypothetical protein
MIPQRALTIRGPNVGIGRSSGQGFALNTALWWHCDYGTNS